MKRHVAQWYYEKLVAALDKAEIRWQLYPKCKVGRGKKPEAVQGYCERHPDNPRRCRITIRYRPAASNHLYILIHEGLHAAFWNWPEQHCWGEPIDLMARQLMSDLSTNQLKKIESYLPER